MELSCDERVLKEMDEGIKKPYANSLLSLATGRYILNGSPLAFGEGNVRGRIKNVLNYKKPTSLDSFFGYLRDFVRRLSFRNFVLKVLQTY